MKITIPVITLLWLCFTINGQESKDYLKNKDNLNYYKGYIISLDSAKVKGLLKPVEGKYSSVTFIPVNGSKTIYYPGDILEYGYLMYKFVPYKNSFYEIVVNGSKIKLYKKTVVNSMYSTGPNKMTTSITNEKDLFFIKKANESEIMEINKRNFDELYQLYFSDCKSLNEKVNLKKWTYKDIQDIVREYNWCR